jgi:lipopolysaccharide transport system ATP-binding protein
MRKAEIARKFDEIVEFSGCARYIDTPVKRYSSGMYVRLAFAVAAHLEPEILIVDEVLAVGDAEFQKKCLGKMKDVAGHGRTILFVSHNMSAVMNLCTRCLYTKNGMIAADGETARVVDCYLRDNAVNKSEVSFTSLDMNACSEQVTVLGARVLNCKGDIGGTILTTEPSFIEVDYEQLKIEAAPKLNIHLTTEDNTCAFACFEIANGVKKRGKIRSRVEIPAEFLNSRSYTVSIYFTNVKNNKPVIELKDILVLEAVDNLDAPSRQDYKGYFPGVVRPVMPWTTSQIC